MTLVLHAAAGMPPESSDAIHRILTRNGFKQQGAPTSIGPDTLHYYNRDGDHPADAVIDELLSLPGVTAAYLKPAGMPPI